MPYQVKKKNDKFWNDVILPYIERRHEPEFAPDSDSPRHRLYRNNWLQPIKRRRISKKERNAVARLGTGSCGDWFWRALFWQSD